MSISIKELVNKILDNYDNPELAEKAINEIHIQFQLLTNITSFGQDIKYSAAVPTATGKALSLNHAAACLIDYKRTTKFLKGMVALIKQKQQEHPNETINIFYAGCGPYAPFVTLVAPLFNANEVQFSLLEINNDSMDLAKKLITKLELEAYINEYHVEDAVTFTIPDAKKYHILFSETLDALLYRESYVPILWNMLPQLSENCSVIPENVIIKANWTLPKAENEDIAPEEFAGTIFDVRKEVSSNKGGDVLPEAFPKTTITISEDSPYQTMIVDTAVHIYDDIWLGRNESSLSIPIQMNIVRPITFSEVNFHYQTQPLVELKLGYK